MASLAPFENRLKRHDEGPAKWSKYKAGTPLVHLAVAESGLFKNPYLSILDEMNGTVVRVNPWQTLPKNKKTSK